MRYSNSNDDLIGFVILGGILLVILYYWWAFVIGFLALVGLYHLVQEYQRDKDNKNRWR